MSHYIPDATTNHFIGLCDECDLHYVSRRTYEEVNNWYHCGRISADMWEAYDQVWAELHNEPRPPLVTPHSGELAAQLRELATR